jgi:hypothetical protein
MIAFICSRSEDGHLGVDDAHVNQHVHRDGCVVLCDAGLRLHVENFFPEVYGERAVDEGDHPDPARASWHAIVTPQGKPNYPLVLRDDLEDKCHQ